MTGIGAERRHHDARAGLRGAPGHRQRPERSVRVLEAADIENAPSMASASLDIATDRSRQDELDLEHHHH